MKKYLQNSPLPSSCGKPQSAINCPVRFASTPPLKRRGINSFSFLLSPFFLLLSPFSTFAVDWSGEKIFNKDSVINYNITFISPVVITVAEGKTVTINGYISGASSAHLLKDGTGTLVFSKTNSYQGQTFFQKGIMRLISTGTFGSSSKIDMYEATKLEIYNESKVILKKLDGSLNSEIYLHSNTSGIIIGSTYTSDDGSGVFNGKITGNGSLEKRGTKTFTLYGSLSYKGHTYINSGKLVLAENASLVNSSGVTLDNNGIFSIEGNRTIKTLNSPSSKCEVSLGSNTLSIGISTTSDDGGGTFCGKITGDGGITKKGTQTFMIKETISTYKGETKIESGKLQLNTLGGIDNSGKVSLTGNAKLEILSGSIFKINNLTGTDNTEFIISSSTALVHLMGSKTTTFSGKFTGSGGTTRYCGTGHLILDGQNECAGELDAFSGTVQLGLGGKNGKWAGNLQVGGGKLVIHGNTTIGKGFYLNTGEIIMDLTAANPSKITVSGSLDAKANTKLSITLSAAVNNYELIKAASGIDGVSIFTLNVPGFPTAKLTANGKQLLFSANNPPVPGNNGKITCTPASTSATLQWSAATDDVTPVKQLRYFVYRSNKDNLSSVAACTANGVLLNPGGTVNITTYDATELTPGATYYFNVVVADADNNRAVYKLVSNKGVGIETVTNDELPITVYPNPTSGQLRITNYELRIDNVEVFDVFGRKVSSNHLIPTSSNHLIDISHFSNGIYFLKITTETGIITKKVLKIQ